jgi:predicted O-methyltransferase YrrM
VIADRMKLLALVPPGGVGIEIGVESGSFSTQILEACNPRQLWLVDCWEQQPQEVYNDHTNVATDAQVARYIHVVSRFREDQRVRVVRTYSHFAVSLFEDGALDFVYIDADHSYEAVVADLKLWWPKVKAGGLFAGHDWIDPTLATFPCGVKPAVEEFCRERGIEVDFVTDETGTHYHSWGIVKR